MQNTFTIQPIDIFNAADFFDIKIKLGIYINQNNLGVI